MVLRKRALALKAGGHRGFQEFSQTRAMPATLWRNGPPGPRKSPDARLPAKCWPPLARRLGLGPGRTVGAGTVVQGFGHFFVKHILGNFYQRRDGDGRFSPG